MLLTCTKRMESAGVSLGLAQVAHGNRGCSEGPSKLCCSLIALHPKIIHRNRSNVRSACQLHPIHSLLPSVHFSRSSC